MKAIRLARALTVATVVTSGLVAATVVGGAANADAAVTIPGGYVSLTPTRVLDTRVGNGAPAHSVAVCG